MEEKKVISLTECSSSDNSTENFDWVNDPNFPDEYKKKYLQFPLKEWRNILLQNGFQIIPKIKSFLDDYLKIVHKILKEDIFIDCNFYNDKKEVAKYISNNYKKKISNTPDFFVHKMEKKKFIQLLNERKYMMRTNYQINENIDYISILGEIKIDNKNKINKKEPFKQSKKMPNYKAITEEISNNNEKIIIMYVYDNSFFLFKEDFVITENYPNVYCYIPKLNHHQKFIIENNGLEKIKPEIGKGNMNEDEKIKTTEYIKKEIVKMFNSVKNIELLSIFLTIIFISFFIKVFFCN